MCVMHIIFSYNLRIIINRYIDENPMVVENKINNQ